MPSVAQQAISCSRCGAPAIPLRAAGASFCVHCGAYHVPDPAQPAPDGVLVREACAGLSCPLCAASLREALVAEAPARWCPRCGGLLCDMASFAHIVKARRAEYAGAESPPQALNPAELVRDVRCPRCRATMETHPYAGPGNVVIDTCAPCGLVWLDSGELTALDRAPGKR